jgi:hypothetical protein
MRPISDGAGSGVHRLLDSTKMHRGGDYHCTVGSERSDLAAVRVAMGLLCGRWCSDPGTPWGLCGAWERCMDVARATVAMDWCMWCLHWFAE